MFYINDGYVTADEVKGRSYSMYNKNNVRSLPVIARPSSNYVVSSSVVRGTGELYSFETGEIGLISL